MRQEGRWPKLDSCPLRAWHCKWPRKFCRPTARVSANTSSPSRSCWPCFVRSEEHTSELQSHLNLVCRLLLEKKKKYAITTPTFLLDPPAARCTFHHNHS